MKFNIYKSIAVCSLVALAGCHDFEEMNTNPYQPGYIPEATENVSPNGYDIDYQLSEKALASLKERESGIGSTLYGFFYDGAWDNYQTTTNLTHDIYAGYTGNNVSGFLTQAPTYAYTESWSANRWNQFYDKRSNAEYSELIRTFWFCDKNKYHAAFYISRIYYAFLLSMQTDTYGDIPLEYYIKGAAPVSEQVSYTKQEDVYAAIFYLLDQAITELNNNKSNNWDGLNSTNDIYYGGDVDKWIRFANTLRLRLALRISNVNPEEAKKQGEAALNGGVMQSHEDRLALIPKYRNNPSENQNVFAEFFSWGSGSTVLLTKEMEWAFKNQALKEGAGNFTEEFNTEESKCYLDPRCEMLWFRPSSYADLNQAIPEQSKKSFNGVRNGALNIGGSYLTTYSSARCCVADDAMDPTHAWWYKGTEYVWMGYPEALFLQAEAALRGWNGGSIAQAKQLYLDGVKASMEYYQISSSDYQPYIDHLNGLSAFDGTDKEAILEQIITQKWIAVFPNGNEGWAEVRRTDYPRYLLVVEGGNNSGGEIYDTKLIKRISYPDREEENPNRPDITQGDRVWWDVDDTMDNNGKWQTPHNFR